MATVSCNVNLILIVIDSDEDTLISAQLRLGLGGAIPCELLFDDPHGEDNSDDDSDDDDDEDDDDDDDDDDDNDDDDDDDDEAMPRSSRPPESETAPSLPSRR